MRFPFSLTAKIAAYLIGHKIRGTKKFATVLQLEPLLTCNLTCTGCGRIREYSTSLKDVLPLADCQWLPPCQPGQILGLWNNFRAAAEKNGWATPAEPLFFAKAVGSLNAHGEPIPLPSAYDGRVL